MSGNEIQKAPEITLIKSEIEAAAARVAERAMNTTLDGVSTFVGDAFGGWVGDSVKQWRTRRLVTALAKTKDHLQANGIAIENAKALPTGELLEIFEGASKTEDVDLTEMWAALLSNAMNPSKEAFIDPSFVRTLQNLSGLDARILTYVKSFSALSKAHHNEIEPLYGSFRPSMKPEDTETIELQAKLKRLNEAYKAQAAALRDEIGEQYSPQNISYSVANLLRLGLLSVRESYRGSSALVRLKGDHYREEIVVDDEPLRRELEIIRNRFDLTSGNEQKLFALSYNERLSGGTPVPSFSLSGLGERFLAACT